MWDDNIKIHLKAVGSEDVNWINLAQIWAVEGLS
jgi:hypothetical protein